MIPVIHILLGFSLVIRAGSSQSKGFRGGEKSYGIKVEATAVGTNLEYQLPQAKVKSSSATDWQVDNDNAEMISAINTPVFATVYTTNPKFSVKGQWPGYTSKFKTPKDVEVGSKKEKLPRIRSIPELASGFNSGSGDDDQSDSEGSANRRSSIDKVVAELSGDSDYSGDESGVSSASGETSKRASGERSEKVGLKVSDDTNHTVSKKRSIKFVRLSTDSKLLKPKSVAKDVAMALYEPGKTRSEVERPEKRMSVNRRDSKKLKTVTKDVSKDVSKEDDRKIPKEVFESVTKGVTKDVTKAIVTNKQESEISLDEIMKAVKQIKGLDLNDKKTSESIKKIIHNAKSVVQEAKSVWRDVAKVVMSVRDLVQRKFEEDQITQKEKEKAETKLPTLPDDVMALEKSASQARKDAQTAAQQARFAAEKAQAASKRAGMLAEMAMRGDKDKDLQAGEARSGVSTRRRVLNEDEVSEKGAGGREGGVENNDSRKEENSLVSTSIKQTLTNKVKESSLSALKKEGEKRQFLLNSSNKSQETAKVNKSQDAKETSKRRKPRSQQKVSETSIKIVHNLKKRKDKRKGKISKNQLDASLAILRRLQERLRMIKMRTMHRAEKAQRNRAGLNSNTKILDVRKKTLDVYKEIPDVNKKNPKKPPNILDEHIKIPNVINKNLYDHRKSSDALNKKAPHGQDNRPKRKNVKDQIKTTLQTKENDASQLAKNTEVLPGRTEKETREINNNKASISRVPKGDKAKRKMSLGDQAFQAAQVASTNALYANEMEKLVASKVKRLREAQNKIRLMKENAKLSKDEKKNIDQPGDVNEVVKAIESRDNHVTPIKNNHQSDDIIKVVGVTESHKKKENKKKDNDGADAVNKVIKVIESDDGHVNEEEGPITNHSDDVNEIIKLVESRDGHMTITDESSESGLLVDSGSGSGSKESGFADSESSSPFSGNYEVDVELSPARLEKNDGKVSADAIKIEDFSRDGKPADGKMSPAAIREVLKAISRVQGLLGFTIERKEEKETKPVTK
ncbi:predicted protein [Nematostella vectensis]|uniref:Muscle M-line assembly protein unc-89-like n=1 Tax=Nematostella vectensis TaxID=45351 RepID=A7RXX5_NEMVE|nr:predicted protein [Nematostella vectensis]|eukprot:XP_001635763.1 predicted protein [Nematostella vectensis]